MTNEIDPRQIWRNKATGVKVKVLKVGPTLITVHVRGGDDDGKTLFIKKPVLLNKYNLLSNV